MSKFNN